jgi:hypothetical protein
VLALAALLLGAADLLARPGALVAVALAYGLYRAVLVLVDARLQAAISGDARATVTSVAGLGTDLLTYVVYGAWALGELPLVVALFGVVALSLPIALRRVPALAR